VFWINVFKDECCVVCRKGECYLSRSSKKAKTAGLEQHRQALRAKKMKRKEKKKVELPAKHKKK
jgi:hypothetical protein